MDLIDRYLHAVRFWLPKAQRQDIIAELSEDIRLQKEDKEAEFGRTLSEDDVADLLKRRGTPFSVAEQFLPQRSLIGPGLFPIYLFVLKLVGLVYLIPWLAIWASLVFFVPSYRAAHPGWSLVGTLGTLWQAAFYTFGMITLGFAVGERIRHRHKFQRDWNPRHLPTVRDVRKISRVASLTTAVCGAIFLVWWLGGLRFPVIMLQNNTPWRWTDVPVWQSFYQQMLWPIALLTLAAAAMALFNLVRPSWTRLRVGVRAALNAAGATILFLGIRANAAEVQAQWLKMTSPHPGVPTLEALRVWTNVMVFLSLLLAGIICLITCILSVWRVVRWKTLVASLGRGAAAVILIGLVSIVAAAQTASPPQSEGSSIPSDQEIRNILRERIDVQHRGLGIIVGIISREGRRLISYGRLDQDDLRPPDGDTVFEIGSVTKVFTSLLFADMIHRGTVALTDPVARYLPAGVKVPEWKGRPITLVDLATQTSGLPFFPTNYPLIDDPIAEAKESGSYTIEKLYEFLSGYELLHDIGVHWEYSNLGVGLMGFALGRCAGTSYEDLVRSRIIAPLEMTSTAVALSPGMKRRLAVGHDKRLKPTPALDFPEFLAGAGSLRSSANDLLTFLEAFLGYKSTPLAPAMKTMVETQRPAADWLAFLGGRQALGWWVIGQGDEVIIAHAGQTLGYSSSLAYDPKIRAGAVVLSNTVVGGDDLALLVLRPSYPLSKPSGEGKTRKEIAVDPKLFDLYAGKYLAGPNVILVISRDGDKLAFMAPGSPKVRLRAETERDYFILSADVQVKFQVDGEGRVTGLVLHLYSQFNLPAKKIDLDPMKGRLPG